MGIFQKAFLALKALGPRGAFARGLIYAGNLLEQRGSKNFGLLVSSREVLALDWTSKRPVEESKPEKKQLQIAWLMSPPGEASGGHQNLFRFIRFLELAGHTCVIYFYSTSLKSMNLSQIRKMVSGSDAFHDLAADMRIYDDRGVDSDTDAIIATGWETAYPCFLDPSSAKRIYFVQDFEPSFYPIGTQSVLAENTYRFGFAGITAGAWLAQRLSAEYGMKCDSFEFSADPESYFLNQSATRDEIFFYARPVTTRRAYELGVMTLQEFHRQMPDVRINIAGWKIDTHSLPFPANSLGSLQLHQLNEVYNRCRVGLVLSLTNMSLLPLELIASGVIPVINEGQNNRLVGTNEHIRFAQPNPKALAREMVDAFNANASESSAKRIAASLRDSSWDDAGKTVVAAVERIVRLGS